MLDKYKYPRVLYSDFGKENPLDMLIRRVASFLAFVFLMGAVFFEYLV